MKTPPPPPPSKRGQLVTRQASLVTCCIFAGLACFFYGLALGGGHVKDGTVTLPLAPSLAWIASLLAAFASWNHAKNKIEGEKQNDTHN